MPNHLTAIFCCWFQSRGGLNFNSLQRLSIQFRLYNKVVAGLDKVTPAFEKKFLFYAACSIYQSKRKSGRLAEFLRAFRSFGEYGRISPVL